MKMHVWKLQHWLEVLWQINTYREDHIFLNKLLIFHPDKNIQNSSQLQTTLFQKRRNNIQNHITQATNNYNIDQNYKNILHAFCHKVYKALKNFHLRLFQFSPKLAEIIDTNTFLQHLRVISLELLNQNHTVSSFLTAFLHELNTRFIKETNSLSWKVNEHLKKDHHFKNDKYLQLLKNNQIEIIQSCHNRALKKIEDQLKNINQQIKSNSLFSVTTLYKNALEVSSQNCAFPAFNYPNYHQNSQIYANFYKQEGFCQFVLSKWNRIFKDLKNKNCQNQKFIQKYQSKRQHFHNHLQQKKVSLRNSSEYSVSQKCIDKNVLENEEENQKCSEQLYGILLSKNKNVAISRNNSNIKVLTSQLIQNCTEMRKIQFQKIHRFSQQNRSFTLRPLTESKENSKQTVKQAIVEMKLDEKHLITKILRIRKKRPLLSLKEDNELLTTMEEKNRRTLFLN